MDKLNYLLFRALLLISVMAYFSVSSANSISNKKTINILTWWEYLNDSEIIKSAENECEVKISFDEYFSNDEFIRRWEGQKESYDLLIFSDTIYDSIKNKIPHINNSTLYKQSETYHPIIKSHYKKTKYPHNVAYFYHSITGFLWNPSNITISKDDSITSIFKKAKHNYVVIIDDPVDANMLIEASLDRSQINTSNNDIMSISNFKKMTQESKPYITNNFDRIYNNHEFAFAFNWSGVALTNIIRNNKSYKFLIHPKLSYISSDLVAQTSTKKSALCVATFLTRKKTITELQKSNFYFSPYADYSTIQNPIFKEIYSDFVTLLPTLYWADSNDEKYFKKINMSWQLIKLSLNNHNYLENKHED